VVDQDGVLSHAGKGALLAVDHRAHVIVVADAHHDEIAVLGRLARRRGMLAAVLLDPLLSLGRGAVIDRNVVAAFFLQVARHGIAHDAESKERNFRHRLVS
jgi:hypothetical protein